MSYISGDIFQISNGISDWQNILYSRRIIMKKKSLFAVILGIMLIFGLTLTGCGSNDSDGPVGIGRDSVGFGADRNRGISPVGFGADRNRGISPVGFGSNDRGPGTDSSSSDSGGGSGTGSGSSDSGGGSGTDSGSSGSDSQTKIYALLKEGGIKIDVYYDDNDKGPSYNGNGANGFSITVAGQSQTIDDTIIGYGKVAIFLTAYVPNTGAIKVSYDGTGTFAGRVPKFTDLNVSR
jgi:hypothetical protein